MTHDRKVFLHTSDDWKHAVEKRERGEARWKKQPPKNGNKRRLRYRRQFPSENDWYDGLGYMCWIHVQLIRIQPFQFWGGILMYGEQIGLYRVHYVTCNRRLRRLNVFSIDCIARGRARAYPFTTRHGNFVERDGRNEIPQWRPWKLISVMKS